MDTYIAYRPYRPAHSHLPPSPPHQPLKHLIVVSVVGEGADNIDDRDLLIMIPYLKNESQAQC